MVHKNLNIYHSNLVSAALARSFRIVVFTSGGKLQAPQRLTLDMYSRVYLDAFLTPQICVAKLKQAEQRIQTYSTPCNIKLCSWQDGAWE